MDSSFSSITEESGTHVKRVKITLNIFAVYLTLQIHTTEVALEYTIFKLKIRQLDLFRNLYEAIESEEDCISEDERRVSAVLTIQVTKYKKNLCNRKITK